MNIIIPLITVVISLAMTYVTAYFRSVYLIKEESGFADILKKQKIFLIVVCILYILVSVAGIILCKYEKYEILKMPQFLLLWECIGICAFIDFNIKKIPNRVLLIGMAGRIAGMIAEVIYNGFSVSDVLLFSCMGAVAGGGMILLCMLFAKDGVGAGDLKIYTLVGFYLGLAGVINVMFYSLFSAALVGIVLLVSKKAKRKTQIPMAPFIFLGLNLYLLFY